MNVPSKGLLVAPVPLRALPALLSITETPHIPFGFGGGVAGWDVPPCHVGASSCACRCCRYHLLNKDVQLAYKKKKTTKKTSIPRAQTSFGLTLHPKRAVCGHSSSCRSGRGRRSGACGASATSRFCQRDGRRVVVVEKGAMLIGSHGGTWVKSTRQNGV